MLSAFASTLAVLIGACFFVLHASPQSPRDRGWSNHGLTMGESIYFESSGRYEHDTYCCVCPPDMTVRGQWHRSGDLIVLDPDEAGLKERYLRDLVVDECRMLLPHDSAASAEPPNYRRAFTPEGDHCAFELDSRSF